MALDTLAGLKDAALRWIDHAGVVGATSIIDDCVTLCEARLNKHPSLRLPEQETELQIVLTDEQASLPANFLAMKRVVGSYSAGSGGGGNGGGGEGEPGGFSAGFSSGFSVVVPAARAAPRVAGSEGGGSRLLKYAEPGWYEQAYPHAGLDPGCDFYTIIGRKIHAKSSPLQVIYYARIPALATTDPNWLLSKAPDVYLYGVILEVLNALEGDATPKYTGLYMSAVEALITTETFSRGGVLTMRAMMPTP